VFLSDEIFTSNLHLMDILLDSFYYDFTKGMLQSKFYIKFLISQEFDYGDLHSHHHDLNPGSISGNTEAVLK